MYLHCARCRGQVDETVWKLYSDKMQAWAESVSVELEPIVAAGNEDQKSLETFTYMLDELKRADPLRRSEPVLAVGGGVLTDTAGFACACWRRGIPWCRMPTTLLGIVDASVGIKVAINYHRKNGVGHFFSPSHTFCDKSFLTTVTLPDIRSGVGEIMKAGEWRPRAARVPPCTLSSHLLALDFHLVALDFVKLLLLLQPLLFQSLVIL